VSGLAETYSIIFEPSMLVKAHATVIAIEYRRKVRDGYGIDMYANGFGVLPFEIRTLYTILGGPRYHDADRLGRFFPILG
jgi:hypothetical protein